MNLLKMTSISKKILLALVGSFLIVFLLLHLAINLCLLRNDAGSWFITASHFMGTNYIIRVFEVVLFLALLSHLCLACLLQIQNWRSRPVRYKVLSKSKTSFMSKYMIWSGGLVLCFLALHFFNFYFVKYGLVEGKYLIESKRIDSYFAEKYRDSSTRELSPEEQQSINEDYKKLQLLIESGVLDKNGEYIKGLKKENIEYTFGADFKHYEPDFYTLSVELFKKKTYSLIYIFLFIALGFHLYHAFRSAFQTLGLNHNKYNGLIRNASLIYAIVISVGFTIIPLYFMFIFKG